MLAVVTRISHNVHAIFEPFVCGHNNVCLGMDLSYTNSVAILIDQRFRARRKTSRCSWRLISSCPCFLLRRNSTKKKNKFHEKQKKPKERKKNGINKKQKKMGVHGFYKWLSDIGYQPLAVTLQPTDTFVVDLRAFLYKFAYFVPSDATDLAQQLA